MSRHRPVHRLASALLAGVVVIQLGSCYRAEIDLSAYADMVAGSGGTSSAGGVPSAASQAGIAAEAGAAGETGSAGAVAAAGAGGEPMQCEDPDFGAWNHSCLISGEKPPVEVCAPQDTAGWRGCYNGGCAVCTEEGKLPGYPYYFAWHPCCSPNDTCSNHKPFYCNRLCPPPTERDRFAPCGQNDPNPG